MLSILFTIVVCTYGFVSGVPIDVDDEPVKIVPDQPRINYDRTIPITYVRNQMAVFEPQYRVAELDENTPDDVAAAFAVLQVTVANAAMTIDSYRSSLPETFKTVLRDFTSKQIASVEKKVPVDCPEYQRIPQGVEVEMELCGQQYLNNGLKLVRASTDRVPRVSDFVRDVRAKWHRCNSEMDKVECITSLTAETSLIGTKMYHDLALKTVYKSPDYNNDVTLKVQKCINSEYQKFLIGNCHKN